VNKVHLLTFLFNLLQL